MVERNRLAMYYNGYIIICIFIGSFIGGFIFQHEELRNSQRYVCSWRSTRTIKADQIHLFAEAKLVPPTRQLSVALRDDRLEMKTCRWKGA